MKTLSVSEAKMKLSALIEAENEIERSDRGGQDDR